MGDAGTFCRGSGAGLRGGSMLAVAKGSSAAALAARLAPQDKQKRPTSGTVALHAGHLATALFPSPGRAPRAVRTANRSGSIMPYVRGWMLLSRFGRSAGLFAHQALEFRIVVKDLQVGVLADPLHIGVTGLNGLLERFKRLRFLLQACIAAGGII